MKQWLLEFLWILNTMVLYLRVAAYIDKLKYDFLKCRILCKHWVSYCTCNIEKVNLHYFIFSLVVFISYLSNRKKFNNEIFLHTIKTRNVLRSIYHKPSFCYFIVQVSRTICYLHTYIIKQCKKSQARRILT